MNSPEPLDIRQPREHWITLFLSGDVMTGKGIEQILLHPGDPVIHGPHAEDARGYVDVVEMVSGPIPRFVAPDHIWGDALDR